MSFKRQCLLIGGFAKWHDFRSLSKLRSVPVFFDQQTSVCPRLFRSATLLTDPAYLGLSPLCLLRRFCGLSPVLLIQPEQYTFPLNRCAYILNNSEIGNNIRVRVIPDTIPQSALEDENSKWGQATMPASAGDRADLRIYKNSLSSVGWRGFR